MRDAPSHGCHLSYGSGARGVADVHDDVMDSTRPGEAIVEAGWERVRADRSVREELSHAAYAEARLRQLFPWTGMGELHFSRCTEKRWTWDIPYISPAAGGGYLVEGPSRSETVGPAATATQAVAMVAERLPPGCGPAFVGSPEDLAAHEAHLKTTEDH